MTLPLSHFSDDNNRHKPEEGRNIFWGSYWEECQDHDLVLSFPGHHEARVAVSLNFKSAHGVHTPQFLP